MSYLLISYQILKQLVVFHAGGGRWNKNMVFKLDPGLGSNLAELQ